MEVLLSIVLFVVLGGVFVFANLTIGSLARPKLPNAQKLEAYECGEPSIGSNWVQFDLRFYIVALVYLVFAVEIALFYPWAVAWGDAVRIAKESGLPDAFAVRQVAIVDMLFFFGVILIGFAYLWRFGYLDWVRTATVSNLRDDTPAVQSSDAVSGPLEGAGNLLTEAAKPV
ncbi:MAG TPA: NADH-quinone oxidoreductase subunit A [Tepidisphaeraceae bacterium]|jgi:NADH-quinone oxidoreductase subunit A|nr:NADH-quinone oxidoreductase subunit A [Tepidisphaeraceae bacterium]